MISRQSGYSLLEMILAMAVGSIVIAASYASYAIIGRQFTRNIAFSEVQEGGLAALSLVSRDLRMAGYKALDAATLESTYGAIAAPLTITDSDDACCDSVAIIYDQSTILRQRITYYVAARANPVRNALFMDVDTWDGATWTAVTDAALVVDYVEDFQLEGSDLNVDGNPALVDVSLVMRSQTPRANAAPYVKNDYDIGNYNINENDRFHRDEFNATVNVRNLRN